MAFDITKAAPMSRKAPKSSGPMTYAEAKQASLNNLDKAIQSAKDFQSKHGALPTGNQMPAGLVKVGANGDVSIGWRISNKPVHFTEAKTAYYACSSDWESDIRDLAAQIRDGKHEDALVEAHDRKSKPPTAGMIAKREARAEAKANGEAHFAVNGKTYITASGKLKRN